MDQSSLDLLPSSLPDVRALDFAIQVSSFVIRISSFGPSHGCAPRHRVKASAPMDASSLDRLRSAVRDVPDFPQPGVLFKDITPVLADSKLLTLAVDGMAESVKGRDVDKVVGIDAR